MAEYIDRDELLKELCTVSAPTPSESWIVEKCIEKVNEQPTADVVPKSEVDKLELTLQGVMWSVDKWLDETDYDADPIKRAITMREKTLKIVENVKAEVAREIFAEIENLIWAYDTRPAYDLTEKIAELKKKYTEEQV